MGRHRKGNNVIAVIPYPTITALCQSIRQGRDYFIGCPILADALDEIDYPHRRVTAVLRAATGTGDYGDDLPRVVVLERIVACLYSHETQLAVRWVGNFARHDLWHGGYPAYLPHMNYTRLMVAAHRYNDTGDDGLQKDNWGGSMNWQNAKLDENYQLFWPKFTQITGVPRTDSDEWDQFLRCAC
jgi:hypothetical protein